MQNIINSALLLSTIAAITPGPLMTLIISETLKHGKLSGIKISLAPLITDFPIMLVSIFILSKLNSLNIILGLISLFGACYLMYLSYESISIKKVHLNTTSGNKSILKGVIANFLNPNPYIFFFSVISPLIIKAMKINQLYGVLFIVIFLGIFVLFNILITLSVHKAKDFFKSIKYVYTIKILGIILLLFSFSFLKESLQFLGLIK